MVRPLPAFHERRTPFKVVAVRGVLWCDHPQFIIRGAQHLTWSQLEDCCGATICSFAMEEHSIQNSGNGRTLVVRPSTIFQ